MSLTSLIKKTLSLLSTEERRSWTMLVLLMCFSALLDVVGVASVMPFLAVLARPDTITENRQLNWVYNSAGFRTSDSFLLALGIFSFSLLIISAVARSVTLYVQYRFTGLARHNLSCRLMGAYLAQNYEFFLDRHSGELGTNILSEVDNFTERALTPTAGLISSLFVLSSMTIVLVAVDPISAGIVAGVFGLAYGLIYYTSRPLLSRLSEARLQANNKRFESAAEAFGGIKTVKVTGSEQYYLKRFEAPSLVLAKASAQSGIISQLPKFAVETVAFGGILLLAIFLMLRNGGSSGNGLATTLPVLGFYALAGYRMLPAVQNIYFSISQLKFAGSSIDRLHNEIKLTQLSTPRDDDPRARLVVKNSISSTPLSYYYPKSENVGITDIVFSVPSGKSLGIIGTTGAGKTTLVDIILGLLDPHTGGVEVDGVSVSKRKSAWRQSLGYVPQDIFLTDSSIAENIAFGLPREEIDVERLERSAKLARIHEYVVSQLSNGYETRVGERGVRLSGGQKQRIGIARALYHNPQVVIFDEATSALDNSTESEVMESITSLAGIATLIIVAHRLSTIRKCDQIIVLNRGRVCGVGTYQQLAATNDLLREMINAADDTSISQRPLCFD